MVESTMSGSTRAPPPTPTPTLRERAWLPHLRGVFVAAHIITICALSTPDLGGALNRRAWKAATVQDEFAAWAQRFSRLGADLSSAELEDKLWSLATSWAELRTTLLVPFRPYADVVGARQRWRMFAAPNRVPARLRIAVKAEGKWRTVYEARSNEYTWQERRFDTERIRGAIHLASWPHRRRDYRRLAAWIADEAARDFPEATHVRLSFVRARSRTPEQVRAGMAPPDKEERRLVRDLEDRR